MTGGDQGAQWPRYEVFLQEGPDRPHRNVGSVHAPDAEIALQNARDVFVRRPTAHSLWVAPAESILTCTRQELETGKYHPARLVPETNTPDETDWERFYVFQKQGQRRSMVFVEHTGEVAAADEVDALRRAVATSKNPDDTYVWWICPAEAVTGSRDADIPSMFAPAIEKRYRRPQEYRTVTMMHDIKSSAPDEEEQ